jgi:hypothetical protein
MDQPSKLLDRLPQLPPRPSSRSNLPAQSGHGKEDAAKKRLTARLETMGPEPPEPPAVEARTAAVAGLMVANFIGDEGVRGRFVPLAEAKLFDVNALDDLPVAARFVLRILPKLGPDLDQREHIPRAQLLARVKQIRDEMLRLAERHLGDTDEAHGRIVTIKMGSGAADDVHDLRMLADLWGDYATTLAKSAGTAYRPATAREAREMATHLELALLGPLTDEDHEWRGYLYRALAMLVPLYDEVGRAGRFLFHHENPESRFPTLASVARVRRRLKREAPRRTESGDRMSGPISTGPKSFPPEVSLVDVPDEHEEALAEAMTSVPSSARITAAVVAHLSSSPPVAVPVPPSALPPPPPRVDVPSFDPVEVVRLDFSPAAAAGEDADGDLGTADLDLEVTFESESNFYSDVAGTTLGLFVATFVVKKPGTPIAVRLAIPALETPFLVSGEVQWVREFSPQIEAPPGMGVALKPLSPAQKRAVDEFSRIRPPILHDA